MPTAALFHMAQRLRLGTGAAPRRPLFRDRQWRRAYLWDALWRFLTLPGLARLQWCVPWPELWTAWCC